MLRNVTDAKSTLKPVFDRYEITRAILFGSVARGTVTPSSDLDLLVDSNLHGLKFTGFMEDIYQAAGMPVDVIDVTHIEKGSPIEPEIHSTGVTIYER